MASIVKKSNNIEYLTPPEIYNPLLEFIGLKYFDIDVCCSNNNIPALHYITRKGLHSNFEFALVEPVNSLKLNWVNTCWMNPPFNECPIWVKKAFKEGQNEECEVWCLLPANRFNANYFQKCFAEYDNWFLVLLEGKYNFLNSDACEEINSTNKQNGGLNTPLMILYIGQNHVEYARRWRLEKPICGIVLKKGV